ncbi:MAG TPA: ABC transporter permease [Solirubrobacterales bacterium]|nr:ABC transporter permease [Solirubrobacterales bacterium]
MTDFKQHYHGNVLGYFWTLAKPLLLFGVLYVAFTKILNFGGNVAHYPAVIITGIVLYNYFAETTSQSLTSLVAYESLVRKVPVPLLVIPLGISLRAFFTVCLNLIAVLVFLAISDVAVTWRWLEFPVLLAALLVLSASVGALLADLYVPFRDMSSIWEILLQLLFWASPIIYPIEQVPTGLREVIMLNPLAVIITDARHVLIDPSAPTATQAMSNPAMIAIPIAIVLAVLVASVMLYRWITPRIAEQL